MKKDPFVSVIIPTYFDWDRLQLCLSALNAQCYPQSQYEVIVINNAPSDLRPKHLKTPDNCRIISEDKSGSYAARNAALKIAKGEFLAFTDSDCIPDANWLKNGIAELQESGLHRIGGNVEVFAGKKPSLAELYDLVFAFPQQGYVEDMGWAVTANLFVTRELVKAIGPFNTHLKSGGDYEWGMRAKEKGYDIKFSKDVIVHHPARKNVKELLKKAKRVRIGLEDKNYQEKGKQDLPSLQRQLYIIFRPRLYDLQQINEKSKIAGLSKLQTYKILLLHNLILGYGDYHSFKKRRELSK